MAKRTVYFGPPINFYEPKNFDRFVKTRLSEEFGETKAPERANLELVNEMNLTYHFPEAGIGVEYQIVRGRCLVNLLGMREDVLERTTELIFSEDGNQYNIETKSQN